MMWREAISSRSIFYLMRFCRIQDFRSRDSRNSIAGMRSVSGANAFMIHRCAIRPRYKGYPIPLSKKSCARVVTYRQCAHQHFEKTPGPLKRKYFMNFFLSSCEESCSYLRVSIRRADSTSCHPISKAAALILPKRRQFGLMARPSLAVAHKIRHAIN
jgi:hypothetical protein